MSIYLDTEHSTRGTWRYLVRDGAGRTIARALTFDQARTMVKENLLTRHV